MSFLHFNERNGKLYPITLIEQEFDCDLSNHKDKWKEFDIPQFFQKYFSI